MILTIIGFILAGMMGIILGLIGGGGSILTLPILVYFFGLPVGLATAYSLFVVGVTSTVGAALVARLGMIDIRAAAIFAPVSALTVFLMRRIFLPLLPDSFSLGTVQVSLDSILLFLFATVILASSISMIRHRNKEIHGKFDAMDFWRMIAAAAGVGLITGAVGAGGGFLFVPALILFGHLPVNRSVGTSLAVIAINSLMGFTGDLLAGTTIDWKFLLFFSIAPVVGIFAGVALSVHIPANRIKNAFGWFLLVVGTAIMLDKLL